MNVTSAPARRAAIAWFDPLPPGPSLKTSVISVSPIAGSRLPRNERSATNTPRTATRPLPLVMLQVPRMSRSEEHTSELQSLMRISYAVFCLKKQKKQKKYHNKQTYNIKINY